MVRPDSHRRGVFVFLCVGAPVAVLARGAGVDNFTDSNGTRAAPYTYVSRGVCDSLESLFKTTEWTIAPRMSFMTCAPHVRTHCGWDVIALGSQRISTLSSIKNLMNNVPYVTFEISRHNNATDRN